MTMPPLSLALIEPEIPQNTGNIGRLAVALGLELILVGPCGFRLDDRALRRAGMDYWKQVRLVALANLEEFRVRFSDRRWVAVDPRGRVPYHQFAYAVGDILLFGSESRGLPFLPAESVHLPMRPGCRSLNLANAAAVVAYEAMKPRLDGLNARPPI